MIGGRPASRDLSTRMQDYEPHPHRSAADGTGSVDHPTPVAADRSAGRRSLILAVSLAVSAWIMLCLLHRDTDGLWLLYDASNHLANGIFVGDYLSAGLPHPADYARAYIVRYPNISPANYPPGFYLLEGAAFSLFGPSPTTALGLVLGFALLLTLYAVAWLRRFVGPGAGFLGAALPLIPAVVQYSHAILLNIPAAALQLASLYHSRNWLEGRGRLHIYPAGAFALAAVFCYQGAVVLVLILGLWFLVSGQWRVLLSPRILLLGTTVGLPLAMLIAWNVRSAGQAKWLFDTPYLGYLITWLWYPLRMPSAFGPPVLAGAALGALAGIVDRRWRAELAYSAGWIAVTYAFHTYLYGKDIRYIVPLAAPLLFLTAVAIWWFSEWARRCIGGRGAAAFATVATTALLAAQVQIGRSAQVLRVDGFAPLVAGIRADAGTERGSILASFKRADWLILTTFVRLGDPGFRLRVVPAEWLWKLTGIAAPPEHWDESAVDAALAHSGCRWIVAEADPKGGIASPRPLDSRLREVLRLARFRLIGTYGIHRPEAITVLLYRQDGPVGDLTELAEQPGARSTSLAWLVRRPIEKSR